MYQGTCLVHAHAQPVLCHHQQNTTFISSHTCSRGDNTGDTLLLHKARTKARASFMPVHNKCNEIKNKTQHLLVVTHAAEATTQETHCSCTRNVPRRVPHPCLCTTGVMKSRANHLSAIMHAAEATTQETHYCCTRHVPSRMPRPCPCTTGVMKSRTDHFSALTHAAEATAQETHCCCTRHVPRRVSHPCPFIAGVI